MLFHVYGGNALYQWGAMILVLVGLILLNEVARRTKLGGLIIFGAVPVVLTIYFIVIAACAAAGQTWAVENQTDRKSTRLNSSHQPQSRMPSSA